MKTLTKRQHSVRVNYLRKAQAVQKLYQEVRVDGQPDAYIWRTHIYPQFFISLDTFYRYLQVSPSKELKEIGAQLKLDF